MFENLDASQQIALISAGAAILGSIIGAVATLLATWLSKKVQMGGKVSLHAKMVYSKDDIHQLWGFYNSGMGNGVFMRAPIWLDVCNTCGVSRVIRNVNLYAYSNKKEVAAFTQVQRTGSGDNAIPLGDNESYTLVVPANSARRFSLDFILKKKDMPENQESFDELILSYFDEKNCIHAFRFTEVEKCWVPGPLKMKKEWITFDKRNKYAR